MVKILATTVREGEQTPYVNFTIDEKVETARMPDQMGVDIIQAADPSVSPGVGKAIQRIAVLDCIAHQAVTPDLGGVLSTEQVTKRIVSTLEISHERE